MDRTLDNLKTRQSLADAYLAASPAIFFCWAAEQALQLSQEKYRALVETTHDFIWEVDTKRNNG